MKYYLTTTGIKQVRVTPERLFRRLMLRADDRALSVSGLATFMRMLESDAVLFLQDRKARDRVTSAYPPKDLRSDNGKDFKDFDTLVRAAIEQGVILLVSHTEITEDSKLGFSASFCLLDARYVTPVLRKVFISHALSK